MPSHPPVISQKPPKAPTKLLSSGEQPRTKLVLSEAEGNQEPYAVQWFFVLGSWLIDWYQDARLWVSINQRGTRYLLALGALVVLVWFATSVSPSQAQEPPPHQAGVVIRHGDGQVTTSCVTFSEPSISGLDLLRRAGVQVIAQDGGIGAAVCSIGGEGCNYPSEDCFCKCKSADCQYWAYQHLRGDHWAYSPLGAASATILPGSVDGWAWGAGSVDQGATPPIIPLEQICTVPGSPASPTNVPAPSQPPTATRSAAVAPTQAPTIVVSLPATVTASQSPTSIPATPIAATRTEGPTAPPITPAGIQTTVVAAVPTEAFAPATIIRAIPTTPAEVPIPTTQASGSTADTSASNPPASNTGDYLVFGLIAAILAGGILAVARRRR